MISLSTVWPVSFLRYCITLTLTSSTIAVTSSFRTMTSSWLSPLKSCLRRQMVHRRKTCLLLALFVTSVTLTLLLLSGNNSSSLSIPSLSSSSSEDANLDIHQKGPKFHLKNRLNVIKSHDNIVHNPLQYLTSRTVGPGCDALIVVVVTSAPDNVARRQAIRKTWGRQNPYNQRYDWQYVFAIARSSDQSIQDQVASEMDKHNDILYSNFLDTYRNLTTKVLNAMAWVRYQCQNAKFLLKTDDDCFLNTVILPRLLQDHHAQSTGLYVGHVFTTQRDLTVLRDEDNQWSLTKEEYKENYYPPYASGSGYLLSIDVVEALLTRSQYIKPFPVEDAYFGVVLAALGVDPINSGRFTFQSASWSLCNFLYLLVIHHVTLENQKKFMNMALEAQKDCDEAFITKWN